MTINKPIWKPPKLVSLYSGWGGADLGFHQAGYQTILAIDNDLHAKMCFQMNFPEVPFKAWDLSRLRGEILLNYLGMEEYELDVLLLSPPCQGISLAGLCDPFDPRNQLFLKSIRWIIAEMKPKVFVIENVDNLTHGEMRIFYRMVLDELESLEGYTFSSMVLNALHYHTPQSRDRIIIIGTHTSVGKEPSHPEPDLAAAEHLRLRDVLPEIDGLLYGYGFNKLKWKDEFSNTVTKTPNLMAQVNGKPEKLSIRQVLKLCGYPPDWKYDGSYDQIWNRAGNSIMPPLAYAIARHLLTEIFGQ